MLNPKVGEIELMSSPMNFFRIVVLPALSKPLKRVKKITLLSSITLKEILEYASHIQHCELRPAVHVQA